MYVKKFGKLRLIEVLKSLFTCRSVSESHKIIATIPWQVTYTTNYDNVLELSYSQVDRKLSPVLPNAEAKGKILSDIHCMHINGYAIDSHENDLESVIKLSNSSYLTQAFENSDWAFAFRKSLNIAKAIIFIGYSMYDLDIQRIIHNIGDIKDKIIFIEREDMDTNSIEFGIQSDFGSTVAIGLEGFANKVVELRNTYIPQTSANSIFYLNKIETESAKVEFRDNSVFNLFLRAEFSISLLMDSLRGDLNGPYFLKRTLHGKALDAVANGARILVVHSDMANGKTAFTKGLACEFITRGYDVYELDRFGVDFSEDLKALFSNGGKKCLIVENGNRHEDCITQFKLMCRIDDIIIITYRSTIFEHKSNNTLSQFDENKLFIADLDYLTEEEISSLSEVMSTYKFWGNRDALPDFRKERFIKVDCNSQLSSVLLEVVKSPNIRLKFDEILREISGDSEVSSILVVSSVLLILDYSIDNYLISELIPTSKIYKINLGIKESFSEIISRNNGRLEFRSSILAKYALNEHSNGKVLVDQLIDIARNAHNRALKFSESDMFFGIYRSMVTFSVLQGLLPEKGKRDCLIRFYESMKNLDAAKSHPHFWLQYAIARLASDGPDDLEKAKLFLDTAFARAKNLPGYHTKHMDNVYARYLVKMGTVTDDINLAMGALRQAHTILIRQARSEKNESPYRVARHYSSFFGTHRSALADHQKTEIVKKCQELVDFIPNLKLGHSGIYDVNLARKELVSIISGAV